MTMAIMRFLRLETLIVAAAVAVPSASYAQPAATSASTQASGDLPFYDAQGAKIVPPPPPPPPPEREPHVGSIALNVSEVFLPQLSSNGALVEALGEFDIAKLFGVHLGYANLGGQNGINAGLDLRYRPGIRLFQAYGWTESLAFPATLSFLGFPGAIRRPTAGLYAAAEPAIRASRCFRGVSLVMSFGPRLGFGFTAADQLGVAAVVLTGARFDIGLAFWP